MAAFNLLLRLLMGDCAAGRGASWVQVGEKAVTYVSGPGNPLKRL